jgi:hypothetical protein
MSQEMTSEAEVQWMMINLPMKKELLHNLLMDGWMPTSPILTTREKTAKERLDPNLAGALVIQEMVLPVWRMGYLEKRDDSKDHSD